MARRLKELGFREAYALEGGFDAWLRAGYGDEPKSLVGQDPMSAD